MTFVEFRESLVKNVLPENISVYVKALWYDAKGDWDKAHTSVDDLEDRNAYWVHAYLHRKEGDVANAQYWYRRAGKNLPSLSLEEEWESIVKVLL